MLRAAKLNQRKTCRVLASQYSTAALIGRLVFIADSFERPASSTVPEAQLTPRCQAQQNLKSFVYADSVVYAQKVVRS